MPAFAPAGNPALQDQSNPGFLCKFILTSQRGVEKTATAPRHAITPPVYLSKIVQ